MKKSNILTILIIFILPLVLFHFFKASSENNSNIAFASKGIPTVIKFYSTMCHECKTLQAELNPLIKEYSGKIAFDSINVSTNDQTTATLMQRYNVNVVPTLVFLDRKGNLVRKTEGYIPSNQLRGYLEDLKNK